MTDPLAEIRARDECAVPLCTYRHPDGTVSATFSAEQEDRRTLLRLLDATREELAGALGKIDRLAAENRLVQAILEQDRPGSCGRTTIHTPHRWLPSRSALDCPGLGPDAETPRNAPRVGYEFGFERMDPPDSGPMLIGRPEADVRAVMTDTAARFPECRYALRRRIVGPWVTVETGPQESGSGQRP